MRLATHSCLVAYSQIDHHTSHTIARIAPFEYVSLPAGRRPAKPHAPSARRLVMQRRNIGDPRRDIFGVASRLTVLPTSRALKLPMRCVIVERRRADPAP
jgi:hypothetical protein